MRTHQESSSTSLVNENEIINKYLDSKVEDLLSHQQCKFKAFLAKQREQF